MKNSRNNKMKASPPAIIIADANKIVPIQTKEHYKQGLLRMTGDKKRYGGGPTRVIKLPKA